MIRRAVVEDIPTLVGLGAKLHAVSPFAFIPFDPETVEGLMTALIEDEDAAVFITQAGDGMIGVNAYPTLLNRTVKIAQEAFWWCDGPDALALLDAAKIWASERGCAAMTMGALDDDRVRLMARLYRRMGFNGVERFFLARL
jgi:hypothetical protein